MTSQPVPASSRPASLRDGAVQTGTPASRQADEIVARLERLPFTRFHLHMAATLGVGTFFDAFDGLSMGVALTVIFTVLNIDFVNTGLLVSSAAIGQIIGAWSFGALAERWGRQTTFCLALAWFGLLSVGSALAWSFGSLFVLRVIQGVGLGGEVPIAAALFNECIRGKTRGKVVMAYESVYVWGIFLAPLIGLAVLSTFPPEISWRLLFALGGIPLLVAIYAWFRLPESPRWLAEKGRYAEADRIVGDIEDGVRRRGGTLETPQVRYRADVQKTHLGELFWPSYRRRTLVVYAQQFTTFFANTIVLGWFPILYIQLGGLPRDQALQLTVITGAIQVVLAYVIAFTVDRFGRIPYFKLGYALALAGTLLGLVLTSVLHFTPWPVLWAAGTLIIVGGLFNADIAIVWIPEQYPTRMRAWASSTASSINRVASVIGPVITGLLLGLTFGVQALFLLLTVLLVIGLVVVSLWGVETKQRVLEELSP
ncbi:MAG: MFS transporter [Chloroflexi bacterium]|nr:MFS transporter [Chloroflexota bacterium]